MTDNFHSFIETNANERQQYNGYGYLYGTLLIYLAESKGIDLMQNEYNELSDFLVEKRGHSILIFTPAQRKKFEQNLSPENFTEKELFEFNKEFSEDDNPESGKEMLAAIKLLHDNLKELKEKEILLLSVG